jgi:hypothetical protein
MSIYINHEDGDATNLGVCSAPCPTILTILTYLAMPAAHRGRRWEVGTVAFRLRAQSRLRFLEDWTKEGKKNLRWRGIIPYAYAM